MWTFLAAVRRSIFDDRDRWAGWAMCLPTVRFAQHTPHVLARNPLQRI